MNKLSRFIILAFGTCFFTSLVPAKITSLIDHHALNKKKWTGAGFVGSLWGVLTYVYLPSSVKNSWLAIVVGILFAVWAGHYSEKIFKNHDDSRIVIDEWIGMWVSLFGLNFGLEVWILLPFCLFRFFDSFKGPWGHALQRLPGGWGVSMDDVAAGILANGLTRLVLHAIS